MDEFFRVRYPVISLYSQLKNKTLSKINPAIDKSMAEKVQEIISEQLEEFGSIINGQVLPELENNGIVCIITGLFRNNLLRRSGNCFFQEY